METLDAILTRRSVREFERKPISPELIEKILQAGMAAPSAGGAAPWHFIVVRDFDLLDQVPTVHEYAAMARTASFGILVCADQLLEVYPGNWVSDVSAATQNILLAAHDLGLGAVWTGVYPNQKRSDGFRKLFQIPANITPFAFIPIGYPAQKNFKPKKMPGGRVHQNQW